MAGRPSSRCAIEGLGEDDRSYFAAINRHPAFVLRHRGHQYAADALIALAPVSRADGSAYVGLAVSCDGVHFSSLEPALNCTGGFIGRAPDHPVDGLLRRGPVAAIYVHRDVPGVPSTRPGASRGRLMPGRPLVEAGRPGARGARTLEGAATACRDARGGRCAIV